jgi:uncharacterized glyoxalase superfamily protein PhnB
MLSKQPTQPPAFQEQYSGEGVIFSLEVDDADAAFVVAQIKSLNIVHALRSEDWGQRHFCIKDPNGVYLDIVQAIEPTAEYRNDYGSEW